MAYGIPECAAMIADGPEQGALNTGTQASLYGLEVRKPAREEAQPGRLAHDLEHEKHSCRPRTSCGDTGFTSVPA